jgi:hypothetical protein
MENVDNTVVSEPKTTHFKQNLFKYLFIISIVVLLVSISYSIFLFKNLNSKLELIKQEDLSTKIIPTVIPTKEIINEVTPTVTLVPITSNNAYVANWKTLGFDGGASIKYPSDWAVKMLGEGTAYCFFHESTDYFCDIEISRENFSQAFISSDKKSFEEIMADEIKNSNEFDYTRMININGLKAYENQSSYPLYRIYYLGKYNVVYTISFGLSDSKPADTDIRWRILNTFKEK